MWNNFGGHPTLHRYNYLMSQQHQHDLLMEAERERQLREVNEAPGALKLYYAWMYEIIWYIEQFRRGLMNFGRSPERHSSSRATTADLHTLKVLHAEPARRTKWN